MSEVLVPWHSSYLLCFPPTYIVGFLGKLYALRHWPLYGRVTMIAQTLSQRFLVMEKQIFCKRSKMYLNGE